MRLQSSLLALASLLPQGLSHKLPIPHQNQPTQYAGYLLSTFTDANPSVFWYISSAADPLAFKPLNGGNPVLQSTVGTRAVRDIFLTASEERGEYFVIATDLDINADGFSWDQATRGGSRGLTIWRSDNLVDWNEATLEIIESPEAGMAWAPSVIYNTTESQYYLFWASRLYSEDDTNHTGTATLDRIRYATTPDFSTGSFSEPADYVALDAENIPLIDQEFLYLGDEGRYARFLKDENVLHVYQETTTGGLFGEWTRTQPEGGYIRTSVYEGPAAFPDVTVEGRYYLLMDNYEEYVPFVTEDVLSGEWEELGFNETGLPRGLKHGNVFLLTESEYQAVVARYGV
ncbi:glycosyl hydrolase [Aspergillus similis]